MGEAKLCGKSGGLNLNGVDEKLYVYAGQTIKSGDFVEFIRGVASSTSATSTPKKMSTGIWSTVLSATRLTDTAVFLSYGQYVSSTEKDLYGVVVTLNKTTVTVGTPVKLDTNRDNPYDISAVALTSSKVFITYTGGTAVYLRAIVCTISGTSITAGTAVSLYTNTQSGYEATATRLSDTKVFLTHKYDRDEEYLYGVVCTISGTTITAGTNTALVTNSYAYSHSPTLVSDSQVFIAHGYNNSRYVYGTVASIDGTAIKVGTSVQLTTKTTSYGMRAITVNGLVFVVHPSYDSTNKWYNFYGEVCAVFGMGITVTVPSTQVIAGGVKYSGNNMPSNSFTLLPVLQSNTAVLIHPATSDNTIYTRAYEITRTAITQKTAVSYSTGESATVVHAIRGINLTDEIFFTVYFCEDGTDTNNAFIPRIKLFGMASDYSKIDSTVAFRTYETQVKKSTTSKFNGVAKTGGIGGTATAHSGSVKVSSFSPFEKTVTSVAPIVVDNVLGDLPANLSLQGNTVQPYTRSGKNKIDINATRLSTNGASSTVVDNDIRISATISSSAYLYAIFQIPNSDALLGKTMTLYSEMIPSASNTGQIAIYESSSDKLTAKRLLLVTTSGSAQITFPSAYSLGSFFTIFLYSNATNGTAVSGDYVTYSKLQLVEGSYTADTMPPYEPYGVMPSPNYPSEFYSVQSKSDNLFDSDDALVTKAGFTKQSDGSYYLASPKVISSVWENTEGYTDQMSFSGECMWEKDMSGRGMVFIVHYTDGTTKDFMTNSGLWNRKWGNFKLVTEKGKTVQKIAMSWGTGRSSYFRNIMLNKGTEALPYQPYGYSNVVVTVRGKNYVREITVAANVTIVNGVCTQTTTNTNTDMSWKAHAYQNSTLLEEALYYKTNNGLGVKSFTFWKKSTFNRIRFGLNGATTDTLVWIDVSHLEEGEYTFQWNVLNEVQGSRSWNNIQIEKGSVATAYRSYVSPKLISVPLGDIRLRSTPDGAHDKFVRVNGAWNKEENVTYETINGSESWTGWVEYPRFYVADAKFADTGASIGLTTNKFIGSAYSPLYNNQGKGFYMSLSNGSTGGTHRLFATVDSSVVTFATVAEFKSWLAANPTDVCYHRATPIYTPITDSQLISVLDELENLILQKGYNNIVVNTMNGVAPFVVLDYKAYKK